MSRHLNYSSFLPDSDTMGSACQPIFLVRIRASPLALWACDCTGWVQHLAFYTFDASRATYLLTTTRL